MKNAHAITAAVLGEERTQCGASIPASGKKDDIETSQLICSLHPLCTTQDLRISTTNVF